MIETLDRLNDLRVIEPLIQCLMDAGEDEVRQATVEALGHLGDKRAVSFLLPHSIL